jgi:hypothetical protein
MIHATAAATQRSDTRSVGRFMPAAARVLVGLIFLIMGLNGFLNFLPHPATVPDKVAALMGGFVVSGYMIPLIFGVQVIVAVMLLSNRFVPLALAIIAPVIVNITAFHLMLLPSAFPPAAVTILLYLYLVWVYRDVYRPMLAARVDPFRS